LVFETTVLEPALKSAPVLELVSASSTSDISSFVLSGSLLLNRSFLSFYSSSTS
jgi:hypothetical protein